MNTLRFNLGKGKRYMKWKLSTKGNPPEYIDPDEGIIIMHDCKLKNSKSTAKDIFNGANKRICAHVSFDSYETVQPPFLKDYTMSEVSYNPRIAPYWRDQEGNNIDGVELDMLATLGNKVFRLYLKPEYES